MSNFQSFWQTLARFVSPLRRTLCYSPTRIISQGLLPIILGIFGWINSSNPNGVREVYIFFSTGKCRFIV